MPDDFDVLVTAHEAFPAFERAILRAQSSVTAGFRIFDMTTRLRSAEAREVGETWFDLLADAVTRGVRIDLTVSDFDPVMATALHQQAWRTVRQGASLAELAGNNAGPVSVRAHLHPARAGLVPWLAFLPAVLPRQKQARDALTKAEARREAVGLRDGSLPKMHPVSHHQKIASVDDSWLYIGGLDLNERRYDTPKHDRPSDQTWSDVQILTRNPDAAKAARQHLQSLTDTVSGKMKPTALPAIRRTLSVPRRFQFPYLSPRTCLSEIEEAHFRAFDHARHLIHIETQFMRSNRIADALAKAAQKKPDLSLILILPAVPEELAHDGNDGLETRFGIARATSALTTIKGAFGDRAIVATPVRPVMAARDTLATHAGSPSIHVHNKVLITDATYGLVGSANLNGRSLRWDTEVALEITDPRHVNALRSRLLSHWWFSKLPDAACAPETMADWWRDEIARNAVRRPEARSGFLVPYDRFALRDLAQPVPGVTENIV